MTRRARPVLAGLAVALLVGACATEDPTPAPGERPGASSPAAEDPETPAESGPVTPEVTGDAATGLQVPWGLAFLPDGTALVTERDTARVLAVTEDDVRVVATLDQAAPRGEAGLLGLAVSPTYDDDELVYLYLSTEQDNRVVRATFDGDRLGTPEVVLEGIPNAFIHDGGRIRFGPDGMLYVATGDASEPALAPDEDSLAGKVLRITPDGDPAPDNPDPDSAVWTLGHRNIQGLTFDDEGRLWASEFGQDAFDEVNLIEAGDNYGWPQVEGRGDIDGLRDPERQWPTSEASPSGLVFHEGSLWMAALRGERLWQIPVREDGSTDEPIPHFVGDHGRLRTVEVAPDGALWLTTSNRDGRGDPGDQDDRILVVDLSRG